MADFTEPLGSMFDVLELLEEHGCCNWSLLISDVLAGLLERKLIEEVPKRDGVYRLTNRGKETLRSIRTLRGMKFQVVI